MIDEYNRQFKKLQEGDTLPSVTTKKFTIPKSIAEFNAMFASNRPNQPNQKTFDQQQMATRSPQQSVVIKDQKPYQPYLQGATISAPEKGTISFNSPSSGRPIVETTPDANWLAKTAGAAVNSFGNAVSSVVNRLGDLFGTLVAASPGAEKAYQAQKEAGLQALLPQTRQRVTEGKSPVPSSLEVAGKVGGVASSAIGLIPEFAITSAGMEASKELPIVGKPIAAVQNFVFGNLQKYSGVVTEKAIGGLNIDQDSKNVLTGTISEFVDQVAMYAVFHFGGKAVGKTTEVGAKAIGASEATAKKAGSFSQASINTVINPFALPFGLFVKGIKNSVAARQRAGESITPDVAKEVVNEVSKKVEIPNDEGQMRIPTAGGDILVKTNQKTVLTNLIRGREDIDYKVVSGLGKDIEGNPVASRFEWDFKKKQATIYVTDKTTAVNLGHELGHYFDHKIGYELNRQLSDIIPNYRENRDSVNQMLADYAIERLDGNAKKEDVDTEIMKIVDGLNQEMKVVAAKEARKSANEQFASAFGTIINDPKTRELAPELSRLVEFSVGKDAMRAGEPIVTGEPGSVEEKASTMTALEKSKRQMVKETVSGDQNFNERQAANTAAKEAIAAKEARVSTNSDYKRVLRAVKNSPEFKKDGSISEADGYIMKRGDREIWVPESKLGEYAAKGYTRVTSMEKIAHEEGFESADDYFSYITELDAESRAINRSPIQKQAHEYLMANDKNYAELDKTINSLRDELVREATTVRPTEPASASEARRPAEKQISGGSGLDTGRRIEDRLSYNPDKINAPEDVEKLIKTLAENQKEFSSERIAKSNDEIKELAFEVGVTPEQLMDVQAGSVVNAETAFAARMLQHDLAADLRETLRTIPAKGATPEQLKLVKEKQLRLMGVMKTNAGLRSSAAHLFRQYQIETKVGENDLLEQLVGDLKKVDANAGSDIAQFIKGNKELMEPTHLDKAWHLWFPSVLSGPTTQVKNFLGNAVNMAAEIGRVAATNPAELPQAFFGMTQGIRKGFTEGKRILKEGQTSKFEQRGLKEIKFTGKASFLNYLDYVGRFMSATDAVFREGFRGMELRSLAREQGLREGLKGKALEQRVENLVEKPTQEIEQRANEFAIRGTYNQKPDGFMGLLVSTIERGLKVKPDDSLVLKGAKTAGRMIVPFTRVVANVVNAGMDWSPAAVSKIARIKKEGGTNRQRNQEIGRAVLGTLAMTGFASMAAGGNLSGHGPNDKSDREALYATGWRPNSIKVGDKWYPYQAWGPFAIPMAVVGNLFDGYRYDGMSEEGFLQQATYVGMNTVNSILDVSFLSGLSDLITAFSDKDYSYFERFAAQTITSPVPNLYKQVMKWGDQTQYETNNFKERLLYNLRITSGLKPKLNVWGEKIEGEALSGVEPSGKIADPVINYMVDNGFHITIPGKSTKIQVSMTEKRAMNADEYYDYVKDSGQEIKRIIGERLEYIEALRDDDARQTYVDNIVKDVRERVKLEIQHKARE